MEEIAASYDGTPVVLQQEDDSSGFDPQKEDYSMLLGCFAVHFVIKATKLKFHRRCRLVILRIPGCMRLQNFHPCFHRPFAQ